MRTQTTKSETPSTNAADLSPTTIFGLLADDRRRYALHYLSEKVGAVPVDELAEQIVLWEGGAVEDRREYVLTELHHRHLPRLTDAGVVRHDPERGTVALREAADRLAPYLALSAGEDVQ